jgi:hypothetical protein
VEALERGDPETVGSHRILARIGVGGMAIVYFGRSPGGRAVAVKVMHDEFATDEKYRDRFLREVAAGRTAGGQYSPGVLDADPDAPRPWLAMEYLAAVSLRDAVRQFGPLPEDATWSLAAGLGEALAAIHRAGVLHLDVKPGNVLLTVEGPRLIDFGIAGGVRTGAAVRGAGSPGFMSPEQVDGRPTGPASDVFSLGATLAYALTGSARPDSDAGELRTLISRCLDPDPAARPTVAELTAATDGSDTVSLPPAVLAAIHRRAEVVTGPPARQHGRRAVLAAVATSLVVGGVAAVSAVVSARPDRVAGAARAGDPPVTTTTTTTTTTPVAPITESAGRSLEIILTGDCVVHSLTTTVNGVPETVANVALPWRRIADIPFASGSATWRIDYQRSAGTFEYRVLVDGQDFAYSTETSPNPVTDSADGTA